MVYLSVETFPGGTGHDSAAREGPGMLGDQAQPASPGDGVGQESVLKRDRRRDVW